VPRPKTEQLAKDRVAIRMYRDILGDCFLLRIPKDEGHLHMLIDCGMLQGTLDATKRAERIARDITHVTKTIDVLVVTHEHWDHLSCFRQAEHVFKGIEIHELWLAWTEDSRDEQARRLREGRNRAMRVIDRSFDALAALLEPDITNDEDGDEETSTSPTPAPLNGLTGIMAFFGAEAGTTLAAASERTASILDDLRKRAKRTRFLSPGADPVRIEGATGLAVYVLGPPRDEIMLHKSLPSKKGREVYELGGGNADDDVFLVAALSAPDAENESTSDDKARLKLSLPFGQRHLIGLAQAKTPSNPIESDFADRYSATDAEWRKIDTDWLGAAETLALRLDSDTNNTSLALAIELPNGKVLLFPGDAQVGNWLSWQEHVWPAGKTVADPDCVTVAKLLARTVVYKVAHHGSHNATLRSQGLELMTHPGLVAFIPVDENLAREVKNWNMPFPSLLERLQQRTGGRILQGDKDKPHLVAESQRRAGKIGELSRSDWDAFLDAVNEIDDGAGIVAVEYRMQV
jgi:hypothetical protein